MKQLICETTYYLYSERVRRCCVVCPLHAEPLRAMQAGQLTDTEIMAFFSDSHLH